MIKDIMTAIMNIYLVIVWLIMLPFIYILDRLFGGWKDNKKTGLSHHIFGEWKDNEKEKTNFR